MRSQKRAMATQDAANLSPQRMIALRRLQSSLLLNMTPRLLFSCPILFFLSKILIEWRKCPWLPTLGRWSIDSKELPRVTSVLV